jgi:hypothetical protein
MYFLNTCASTTGTQLRFMQTITCSSSLAVGRLSGTRFHSILCTALPRRRRRTGADPVSARSHFHSDNRTISRLQTAHSRCRQRQNRNRAVGLSESLTVRFADHSTGNVLKVCMGAKGSETKSLSSARLASGVDLLRIAMQATISEHRSQPRH